MSMNVKVACVALLLLCGCTSATDSPRPGPVMAKDCRVQEAAPVQTPVPEVPEAQANVVFKLNSPGRPEESLTVKAAGRVLFEVRLPAHPEDCFNDSVFVRRFNLPPGPVTLEVEAADKRGEVQMTVSPERQWVVIQNQGDFPLSVKVSDEEPLFG